MHARKWLKSIHGLLIAGYVLMVAFSSGCGDDDALVETRRAPDAGRAEEGFAGGDGANGDGANGDGENGDGENGDGENGDPIDLTDDEIVGVMIAANAAEVIQGELAMEQASDAGVRAFATRMVLDHGTANREIASLIETTSLEWGVPPQAERLTADAMEMTDALSALSGSEFDIEYMRAQRMLHTRVLSMIDALLLPSVVNPLLEAQLLGMRAAVSMHLADTDTLLTELSPEGSAP